MKKKTKKKKISIHQKIDNLAREIDQIEKNKRCYWQEFGADKQILNGLQALLSSMSELIAIKAQINRIELSLAQLRSLAEGPVKTNSRFFSILKTKMNNFKRKYL